MMKIIRAISRREIQSYLNSPAAYIVIGAFLFLCGYFFFSNFFLNNLASMRAFFDLLPILFVVFIPAMTMRLIAQERQTGTIELLLTLPVKNYQVVVGKFAAALSMVVLALIFTLPYAISISQLTPMNTQLDWRPSVVGYLGLVLVSSAFISIGIMASSATKNQIVALIISFTLSLFLYVVGQVDVHMANFSRGIIDSRDVIYFASIIFVGLYVAMQLLRHVNWVSIIAVIISMVFLNLIASERHIRFDMTLDHRYTLSKASQQAMNKLNDVMQITVYFTDDLPAPYANHARYLQDLLQEYRALSNDKLSVEWIDPASDPSLFDTFPQIGIEPVQIKIVDEDQEQTRKVTMAVLIQYNGAQEVLPLIQDVDRLEQDLTLKMRKLLRAKIPVIGVISDLPSVSVERWQKRVSDSVEIVDIELPIRDDVLGGVNALVVIGLPDRLNDETLKKIEQFRLSKKGIALLMDRVAIDPESLHVPKQELKFPSSFQKWLSTLGIQFQDDWVADMHCAVLDGGDGVVDYPLIPEVSNMNQGVSLMHGLSTLVFPFVSPIQFLGKNVITLASSTKSSWLGYEEREKHAVATGPYPLLVQVGHRLIVAGTSGFLWDPFFGGANEQLGMRLVDWLMADDVLLAMRARGQVDIPIRDDLDKDVKSAIKLAHLFGIPLVLFLYGLIRWQRREWSRR